MVKFDNGLSINIDFGYIASTLALYILLYIVRSRLRKPRHPYLDVENSFPKSMKTQRSPCCEFIIFYLIFTACVAFYPLEKATYLLPERVSYTKFQATLQADFPQRPLLISDVPQYNANISYSRIIKDYCGRSKIGSGNYETVFWSGFKNFGMESFVNWLVELHLGIKNPFGSKPEASYKDWYDYLKIENKTHRLFSFACAILRPLKFYFPPIYQTVVSIVNLVVGPAYISLVPIYSCPAFKLIISSDFESL